MCTGISGSKRIIGGQAGQRVVARKVDRGRVTCSHRAGRIHRSYVDVERVPCRGGNRSANGEPSNLAGNIDRCGGSCHVGCRNRDRLIACGYQSDGTCESMRPRVSGREQVGNTCIQWIKCVSSRSARRRVTAANVNHATESSSDVAVSVDRLDRHRQNGTRCGCGWSGELERNCTGEVLSIGIVIG